MRPEEIVRLREALAGPLPGHDAFLEVSGYKRPDIEAVLRQRPAPRESAVLVLFYPRRDELHTLLMRRPPYDGVHGDQVSFPGGRREEQDRDLVMTAVREFTEEVGVVPRGLDVLGALSRVYIPPSRSLVTPYVALAEEPGPFAPDQREVAALIETPVRELLRDDILKQGDRYVQVLGRRATVPYFDVQGQVVWGATAMMLAELRQLLGVS